MIVHALLAIVISAGAIFEGKETIDLRKIKSTTNFKLLVPDQTSVSNWNVEVKWPYPLKFDQPIRNLRLHYFDQRGEYVLGIEQHGVKGYTIKVECIEIDARNHTSRSHIETRLFEQSTTGEMILIHGAKAYFEAWDSREPIPGGILHWIQGDTYVEVNSGELTKEQMVEIARSMK
ncbi:hypothetical protein P9847_01185 [Paenibacillus chibensis]|uniref:DUF4367 domain-containing protein n=1 Tax=Paenibacillus chibensis TaxID=59846 RepID=A0ABU6PP19_9BACL|nr:hypothetical protein [Paenibacillus chibensis]